MAGMSGRDARSRAMAAGTRSGALPPRIAVYPVQVFLKRVLVGQEAIAAVTNTEMTTNATWSGVGVSLKLEARPVPVATAVATAAAIDAPRNVAMIAGYCSGTHETVG
jgi:hypothetical protein